MCRLVCVIVLVVIMCGLSQATITKTTFYSVEEPQALSFVFWHNGGLFGIVGFYP
jgi:hypothetical protein